MGQGGGGGRVMSREEKREFRRFFDVNQRIIKKMNKSIRLLESATSDACDYTGLDFRDKKGVVFQFDVTNIGYASTTDRVRTYTQSLIGQLQRAYNVYLSKAKEAAFRKADNDAYWSLNHPE